MTSTYSHSQSEHLEKLFEAASQLVRNPECSKTPSSDVKLRLYGLYKHVTSGPCHAPERKSLFQLVEQSKLRAWKDCRNLTREQAMQEYVNSVAMLTNVFDKDFEKKQCEETTMETRINSDDKDEKGISRKSRTTLHGYRQSSENSTQDRSDSPSHRLRSKTSAESWYSIFISRLLYWLGVRPVVPRGRLDISYEDLCFAVCHALSPWQQKRRQGRVIAQHIGKIWSLNTHREAVVGLSVRSLLDVYLSVKSFDAGSEVIMLPFICVPGIIHVIKHHQLKMVPVDLSDDGWFDLSSLRDTISDRTVAIMVVHPFGMLTANAHELLQIRRLADEHDLEFWEDCAECFTGFGNGSYLGSPHADVTFFSFGMIKTATALGGGIASFLDSKTRAVVQRRQESLPGRQTTYHFLCRAILAFLLNLIASNPWHVGLLSGLCSSCGVNFDKIVTLSIRGFKIPSDAQDTTGELALMQQIRRQPSNTLLALLLRRLEQGRWQYESVANRMRQCAQMTEMIEELKLGCLLPVRSPASHSYWAFPISCENREVVSCVLASNGFDAVSGASQLCCLSTYDPDLPSAPKTEALMNSVLYLPITSTSLTFAELKRLADSLSDALKVGKNPATGDLKPGTRYSSIKVHYLASLAVAHLTLILGVHRSIQIVIWSTNFVVGQAVFLSSGATLALYLLRYRMGSLYLQASDSFARNCDMIVPSKSLEKEDTLVLSRPCSGADTNPGANSRTVVLTGATGFVGSLILRYLLNDRQRLSLSKVIVLCRGKRGVGPGERVAQLLEAKMFDFLNEEEKLSLVKVVAADLLKPGFGISAHDFQRLSTDSSITHVIHCAATVSFTQELPNVAKSNITSTLNLQKLTAELANREAVFVYLSTAFVHGGLNGTDKSPLPEELFPLRHFKAEQIYASMLGTQSYASRAMHELNFPNTYAFSKCICEHLLFQRRSSNIIIVRPSIVGPAVKSPFEGWAGEKPSTLVAGACLHLSHKWNLWYLSENSVPCIPVDILAEYILDKAFTTKCGADAALVSTFTDKSSEQGNAPDSGGFNGEDFNVVLDDSSNSGFFHSIFNATWDTKSGHAATFSWLEFSICSLQLGCVMGYFNRGLAFMTLLLPADLVPRLCTTYSLYKYMHALVVRAPVMMLLRCLKPSSMSSRDLQQTSIILDLPLLFFPFVRKSFHFQSELAVPTEFDKRRYMFSIAVAAHRFIADTQLYERANGKKVRLKATVVGGKLHEPTLWDFWWCISQPAGTFALRVCAWMFIKILRRTCSAVTVDLLSFRQKKTMGRAKPDSPTYLVLASTHRSFFDFILLSYIIFAIPELQIDIPHIVAADDFERLPLLGWIATRLGAIFIRRGRGYQDVALDEELSLLKDTKKSDGLRCIEVFLEGTRSRDRRFVRPRTGILKALDQSGGDHAIVPITINYDKIPEQGVLSQEACGSRRRKMSISGIIFWLWDVLLGKVDLGRIHVAASESRQMDCQTSSDYRSFVGEIQASQQENTYISTFHIKAIAKLLHLSAKEVKDMLLSIDCIFVPPLNYESEDYLPAIPNDESELFTILLQIGHKLAPLLAESNSAWANWLNCVETRNPPSHNARLSMQPLQQALNRYFRAADLAVDQAMVKLRDSGFDYPKTMHIMQIIRADSPEVPEILAQAAFKMKTPSLQGQESNPSFETPPIKPIILLDSEERLGFWGFGDSGFVLNPGSASTRVLMSGTRYSLSGKSIAHLLPFIEDELQVQLDTSHEFPSSSRLWLSEKQPSLPLEDITFLKRRFRRVSFTTPERARHGTGHSQEDVYAIRSGEQIRIPDAVVWPQSEVEVLDLVSDAARKGWCLIPFGGGTNVCNATRCPDAESEPRPIISVDMKAMNKVLWVKEHDGLACIEAGITGSDLVRRLARQGFTMGHEPDSFEFSTLGGWIATKASGMKRSRYGNIEDIVISARVVSSKGILWKGSPDGRVGQGRTAEGLDVCSLITGSEGCLGIITQAVVRIWPQPEIQDYDSVIFPSFDEGLNFVQAVARTKSLAPASVRLLDNAHFRFGQALRPEKSSFMRRLSDDLQKFVASKFYWNFDEKTMVCATICYEGDREEVEAQRKAITRRVVEHCGIALGAKIGKAGYDLTFMIAYLRDFAMTYHVLGESFETFVPWSKIQNLISNTKGRIVEEHRSRLLPGVPFVGCRVTQLYHEGACLYFYLCFSVQGVQNASSVFAELEIAAREEVLKNGGSLSHHHGVGKHRACFIGSRASPALKDTFSLLKQDIDTKNIFGARNGVFA